MAHGYSEGIPLKKKFGQHFLRDQSVVDTMIDRVKLSETTSVFEIGGGDGFLTRTILQQPIARLWVFEIDSDWVEHLKRTINDERFSVFDQNILDLDEKVLEPNKPWTVLANLPYQVTFPILHMFQKIRHLLQEGVVMMQEEVAEKLIKDHGRGYGYPSLFFQHYFELALLVKIPPQAFYPPPKVYSRLVYFRPKSAKEIVTIPHEEEFWKFIKVCFHQPRRTLRNNLMQTQYPVNILSDDTLKLRAQQLAMKDLLEIWEQLSMHI